MKISAKKPENQLPLFMHESEIALIFRDIIDCIPKGTQAYLVGGASRNAVFYQLFKKKLPQRDYDVLLIGDAPGFVANLRKKKFIYGKIRRKEEIVVKRKKFKEAKLLSDFVYLDIHISHETSVMKNLKQAANFTINGFALPVRAVTSETWFEKMKSLPTAHADMQKKQLRINSNDSHPSNLYAALRFMHAGFKAPSKIETKDMLESLRRLEMWRFEKNVKKVFEYVGGEAQARRYLKKLGIMEDVFDIGVLRVGKKK